MCASISYNLSSTRTDHIRSKFIFDLFLTLRFKFLFHNPPHKLDKRNNCSALFYIYHFSLFMGRLRMEKRDHKTHSL